ncbi:hypothetical protein Tco_1200008 [Tanacetum coccineum]
MGVDGPPVMLEDLYAYVVVDFQAPPSPNCVSGPEYPPSPEFVPKPVYPEFMPPDDEVFPAEEQPLPAAVSPTANSPGYIADSDPKEDPTDYPADEGDVTPPFLHIAAKANLGYYFKGTTVIIIENESKRVVYENKLSFIISLEFLQTRGS